MADRNRFQPVIIMLRPVMNADLAEPERVLKEHRGIKPQGTKKGPFLRRVVPADKNTVGKISRKRKNAAAALSQKIRSVLLRRGAKRHIGKIHNVIHSDAVRMCSRPNPNQSVKEVGCVIAYISVQHGENTFVKARKGYFRKRTFAITNEIYK